MEPLKQPKDYAEQIQCLQRDHGLQIDDSNRAVSILSRVSYYRLSAYGISLKQAGNKELYRSGTTIEHVYRLYQFDAHLRSLLISVIEILEIDLRSKVSYFLALKYGPEGYRDPNNFIKKTKKTTGEDIFKATMKKLDDEILRQRNLPCVKHHNQKYGGHFPIWAAVELFSFGMLSSLYSVMQTGDRKAIAREYNTTPEYLNSWILALVEVRNLCAHYGRIYYMPLKQSPKLYSENDEYRSNKIFPLIITIKRMLGDSVEWRSFLTSLATLIESYPEAELCLMGFPQEWQTVLLP